MPKCRQCIAAVALLLISALCRADVMVALDYGWDTAYRPGRWTPVFITTQSDRPQQVILELYAPHDRTFGMVSTLSVAVSPSLRTDCLLIPLNENLSDVTVTVRDVETHKKLGEASLIPENSP